MKYRVQCPLGAVSVDADAREVCSDGQLVVLAPQVFDCIAYLLAHRDRAVGRDELIASVWGRADITDTLLHQTVMKARRAFGDSGEEQQVVRTIPRFGYRWIAALVEVVAAVESDSAPLAARMPPVEPGPPPDQAVQAIAAPATHSARRRPSRIALVLAVLAIALVLAVGAAGWLRVAPVVAGSSATRATHAEALVVLPVEVSGGRDAAWMPLGVMDAIGSYLRDGGVPVVPSQTVMGLLDAHAAGELDLTRWHEATGAARLVQAAAAARGDSWHVALVLRAIDGRRFEASGDAADVLDAARLASEQLLAALLPARQPAFGRDTDGDLTLLLQRTRADMLANRLGVARGLLDSVAPAQQAQPKLRLLRAEIDYRSGHMDAARSVYAPLLHELSAESQPLLRAQTLMGLASVERTSADMAAAAHGYTQAIELLEPLQQPIWLGHAHVYRATALGSLGQFDAAQQGIARGRVLLVGAGDPYGVAAADAALATLNADRGRVAVGSTQLFKAIAQFERLGAQAEALNLRLALAQMHVELLEHGAALEQAERVWRSLDSEPQHRLRVMAGVVYAQALAGNGRLAEAARVVVGLGEQGDTRDYQWRSARGVAAALALQTGDAERAERLAAEVLSAPDSQAHTDVGDLWLLWFRALRTQDKMVAAQEGMLRLADWSARLEGKRASADMYASLVRAEQAWAERRLADSRRDYASALRQAGELGVPQGVATVAYSYGAALLADGALDEAAAVVGQLAAWADTDFDCAVVTARLHRALGNRSVWQEALAKVRDLAGERAVPTAIERFQAP